MQIDFFCTALGYDVVFHGVETTEEKVIYEDRSLTVTTIPLLHRKPCCGFLFKEKQMLPHIRRDVFDAYGVPLSQVNNIKNGQDWITEEGDVIPNKLLTKPSEPARSYAYCSDTKYMPELYKCIKDVDLLYHESTYMDEDSDKAILYNHSTAKEAAMVAKAADAKKLILGHFSARYEDEQLLLDEAKGVFENTFLANEMVVFDV